MARNIIIDRTRQDREVPITFLAGAMNLTSIPALLIKAGAGPVITSLSVSHAAIGASVTITGTGFGSSRLTSTVTFVKGWLVDTYVSWSATQIVVVVNSPTAIGISVTVGGVTSNVAPFTVDEKTATITYGAGTITNPNNYADNAVVVGAGIGVTFLNGHLDFGSGQEFRDMTIQASGTSSIKNKANSSGTVFRRCRFRGGGSGGFQGENVLIGGGNNVSRLSFIDCEIERSLTANNVNTISMYAWNNTIDGVIWKGCHFGVSNGSATGAARMLSENWTYGNTASWWRDLHYYDCVFETCGNWVLDFACYPTSTRGTGVIVSGCTFNGATGMAINFEWPDAVTITGNTFYRCGGVAIVWSTTFCTDTDTGWIITGNTFDWDTADPGIAIGGVIMNLSSSNNIITGNTFISHSDMANYWGRGSGCIAAWGGTYGLEQGAIPCVCTGNTIERNIFYLNGTCVPYSQSGASNTFNQSATNPPTGTYNAVVRS